MDSEERFSFHATWDADEHVPFPELEPESDDLPEKKDVDTYLHATKTAAATELELIFTCVHSCLCCGGCH